MKDFIVSGQNRAFDLIPPVGDSIAIYSLSASTSKSISIPSGSKAMLISAVSDFWLNPFGSTATLPAADVAAGSNHILNPSQRLIPSGTTTMSIISASAQVISIEFFGSGE